MSHMKSQCFKTSQYGTMRHTHMHTLTAVKSDVGILWGGGDIIVTMIQEASLSMVQVS